MTSWHFSRVVILAFVLAMAGIFANFTRVMFAALNAPSYVGSFDRHADIRYGPAPRQSLDVYVPSEAHARRRPVVVFWYGGKWIKGAKEWYRFVGASLADAGYVAVLPDYRLYPQARFPEFIEDGAQALKWTREHAAELGGDPDAIFLMGHSAGAHLAATLALDQRYLRAVGGTAKWIRGWISLSAPYALDTRYGHHPMLSRVFHEPNNPDEWQLLQQTLADSPPALLIHGTRDIYPGDAAVMDASLRSAGRFVECRIYDGVTHMGTVSAFSLPLRYKAPSLIDVQGFIDRTLAGPHVADGAVAGIPCPLLNINERYNITKLAGG